MAEKSDFQEFDVAVFDPTKADLLAIAKEVASITADPSKATKQDLELINETKNKLVKARTNIQRIGKEKREAALKFQKDVIAYENELIGIIEPEEKRLKDLEKGIKEYAIREERLKHLPDYKQQLQSIGDLVGVTDEELLGMDPTAFQAYYNARLGAHLEAKKIQADAEEQAKKDAAEKEVREKEEAKQNLVRSRVEELYQMGLLAPGAVPVIVTLDGEITVTRENLADYSDEMFEEAKKLWVRLTKEKADHDAKVIEEKRLADIKAAEEQAKLQAEEKAKKEADEKETARLAAEAAEKEKQAEEQRKLESEEKARQESEEFQQWLHSNSYNETTDRIIEEGGIAILYREVARRNSK